jgi:plasmid stabilization system protein ParE
MRKRKPRLEFTEAAERDIERCVLSHFLNNGRRPHKRRTQIRREARRIANDPGLYPVEWAHPISLVAFRRKNVDPFVIVYAYFEPSTSMPNGLVSIRAIRHGAQQDIRWGVEESRSNWPLLAALSQ